MAGKKREKVITSVRFTPEIRDELDRISLEQGRDMSEIVRDAVFWWITEYKAKKQKLFKEVV